MEFNYPCTNGHRLFVAETGIDAVGKIIVILVCTTCGEPLKHEFAVEGSYNLRLQHPNKKEN